MSDFDKGYGLYYEPSREIFKFRLNIEGVGFLFAITREALTDCLETEDTKDQAEKNFWEHQEEIIAAAKQFMAKGSTDEEGVFILKTDFCEGRLRPKFS